MAVDDALHGRQTNTGAREFGFRVQSLERSEQSLRESHVEARAIIAHEAGRRCLILLDSELDPGAPGFAGELPGVVQEVFQGDAQQRLISQDGDLRGDEDFHLPFRLGSLVGRRMYESGSGSIINVSTIGSLLASVGELPYAAAKAAITGYTRSTALDLAPYGVTVNAIAPGLILHEGLRVVFSDQALEATARRVPVGRAGKPEEIAATVSFLFSDDAAYITGQTIHVNGGMYLPG